MEPSQSKQVLLKVSTIWISQPTDEAVQAEWTECLSPVSFQAAVRGGARVTQQRTTRGADAGGNLSRCDRNRKAQVRGQALARQSSVVVPSAEERERVKAQLRGLVSILAWEKFNWVGGGSNLYSVHAVDRCQLHTSFSRNCDVCSGLPQN